MHLCVCVYSINLEVQKNAIALINALFMKAEQPKRRVCLSVFCFTNLSIAAGGWLCLSFTLQICPSGLVVDCVCLSLYEFVHHSWWLTMEREKTVDFLYALRNQRQRMRCSPCSFALFLSLSGNCLLPEFFKGIWILKFCPQEMFQAWIFGIFNLLRPLHTWSSSVDVFVFFVQQLLSAKHSLNIKY